MVPFRRGGHLEVQRVLAVCLLLSLSDIHRLVYRHVYIYIFIHTYIYILIYICVFIGIYNAFHVPCPPLMYGPPTYTGN